MGVGWGWDIWREIERNLLRYSGCKGQRDGEMNTQGKTIRRQKNEYNKISTSLNNHHIHSFPRQIHIHIPNNYLSKGTHLI